MNVLLAGASGLTGQYLLSNLLQNTQIAHVLSIGRKTINIQHPKLEQQLVSFDNLKELSYQPNVVFCCLGTTIKKAGSKAAFRKIDEQYPLNLANFAAATGAFSFHVISSMGANSNSHIFYNRVKGSMEKQVLKANIAAIHIYRPSLLLGTRVEKRNIEKFSQTLFTLFDFAMRGPLQHVRAIKAEKVAAYMLRMALDLQEGKFIHLSGNMQ